MKAREPLRLEDLRPFETVDRYAAYLGISSPLLRREIKKGRVPVLYFGRVMRVPTTAALEKLLEEARPERDRVPDGVAEHSVPDLVYGKTTPSDPGNRTGDDPDALD